jgi:ABC-type antimicrobial peptide transport system permease subunit
MFCPFNKDSWLINKMSISRFSLLVQAADVVLTALAVLLVGWLASLYAVRGFSKMEEKGLSRWLKGE